MVKLVSIGTINPPEVCLCKLLQVTTRGFKAAPLLFSEGPVSRWGWGLAEWYHYEDGAYIIKSLGKYTENRRKELKKAVRSWVVNESM